MDVARIVSELELLSNELSDPSKSFAVKKALVRLTRQLRDAAGNELYVVLCKGCQSDCDFLDAVSVSAIGKLNRSCLLANNMFSLFEANYGGVATADKLSKYMDVKSDIRSLKQIACELRSLRESFSLCDEP